MLPHHSGGSISNHAEGWQAPEVPLPNLEDVSWTEGSTKLIIHKKRERSPAAAKAKKSQFKATHGKLFCERCGLVPVEHYSTPHAESCIEVHHRAVQIKDMTQEHRTTLDMLQCLCANCHRLEHKLLVATTS
jgi:5-methylcytosine-specific restriction protein A